jgi:hypothetical protein
LEQSLGGDFVGRAFLTHKAQIARAMPDLDLLQTTILEVSRAEYPDLPWSDWLSLSAALLAFRPSLVLELGRANGTSTALLQYWKNRGGWDGDLISLCNTTVWTDRTIPALEERLPLRWDQQARFTVGDILAHPYQELLAGHDRILVFWDAHGHAIADVVLGRIAPLLRGRVNLVVAHDMRDNRYFSAQYRDYEGKALWRKQGEPDSLWLHIGTMFSTFEQIIPLADFCARNHIALYSATHSLVQAEVPLSEFERICYWHYFSVPSDREIYFPASRSCENVAALENTAGWRFLCAWRRVQNRLAAEGTLLRRVYNALGAIRRG